MRGNQDFINSGKLELYVLGILNDEESQEVEKLAALHPEIAMEIGRIQRSVEDFAEANAETPPPFMKSRILEAIDKTENKTDAENHAELSKPKEDNIISLKEKDTSSRPWLAIAAMIIAILSIALNIYFYNNWKQTENKLYSIQENNSAMAAEFATYKQQEQHFSEITSLIVSASTERVLLQGTSDNKNVMAVAYWNTEKEVVYLVDFQLPPPPADKQYQLWTLVSGRPADAGLVPINSTSTIYAMKPASKAHAFAITLEPVGGSSSPTLSAMVAMGEVKS